MKLTTECVIKRIKEIHGNKYDGINDIVYVNNTTKIKLICPKHGEFLITPKSLFKGCGCYKCANEKNNEKNRFSKLQFIEKARKVHGDKYDYSKVEYVNSSTKVCIICPEHGEFLQRPSKHLQGQGCPECASRQFTTNDFIVKSNEIHDFKYDYSKTNYINNYTPITITCPIHGDFEQLPYVHLNHKNGCPKCGRESNRIKQMKNIEHFINDAKQIHGNKYEYNDIEYNGSHEPIKLYCKEKYSNGEEHGFFTILPSNLLQGYGCPKCNKNQFSKGEKEIVQFLRSKQFKLYENFILENKKELDIYIPDKKIAIEYNGLYWHNELKKPNINYHLDKTLECERQGIRLINIFEDEWIEKQEIVKSRLENILGFTNNKIYGRKCKVKEVSHEESIRFLNENHIQGNLNSKFRYGLYYNNELVSLMTFGKFIQNLGSVSKDDDTWELLRFCNKLNTSVVGGASKLLKHFIKTLHPKTIISYADRRWSDGHLYETLGFEHTHDSKPSYFYVVGHQRQNRFNYRKDKLVKQGFDKDKSEHEIMLERKIYRIYDCGTMKYTMKL